MSLAEGTVCHFKKIYNFVWGTVFSFNFLNYIPCLRRVNFWSEANKSERATFNGMFTNYYSCFYSKFEATKVSQHMFIEYSFDAQHSNGTILF